MHKLAKQSMVVFLSVSLVLFSLVGQAAAQAEIEAREPGGERMAYDAVVLRPLGLCGTVVGAALFVVTLPFTALTGTVDKASEKMVVAPYEFTFKRPVGQW
jgi:hypothetical protein